jgi:hypothetical protein
MLAEVAAIIVIQVQFNLLADKVVGVLKEALEQPILVVAEQQTEALVVLE